MPASVKVLRQAAAETIHEYAFDKGRLGLLKLVAKGLLLVPRQRLHRRWLSVLGGPTTRRLLRVKPRMAYRHSSKYLFLGSSWRDSLALLSTHYAFLNQSFDAPFFERIIGPGGERLWEWSAPGHRLEIVLGGPEGHREGELNLWFVVDGERVSAIAFSIVPAASLVPNGASARRGVHAIYIGHVQGVPGRFEPIRKATRLCQDIAPNDLLMNALSGIAQACRIDRFLSPGPARHLSVGKMPAMPFDYAAFWARYGATLDSRGHYAMDLPFTRKPLREIVNRHRKRTSRKREFKEALRDAVASTMTANLSSNAGCVTLPSSRRSSGAIPRSRTAS